jgi:hypothetical protein
MSTTFWVMKFSPTYMQWLRQALGHLALFLAISLTLTGVIFFLPESLIGLPLDALICAALIAAAVYIYPSRWMAIGAAGLFFIALAALRIANVIKAGVTSFPLTSTDLISVFTAPTGFLGALGISPWIQTILVWALYFALGVAVWRVFVVTRRSTLRQFMTGTLRACFRVVCAIAMLALLEHAVYKTVSSFQAAHDEIPIWYGEGLVVFSERVGILGFLTYFYFFEQGERDHFLAYTPKDQPPSRSNVFESARKYVRSEKLDGVLPNILVIHAESTFDPNDVLNLSSPVLNSLFYSHQGDQKDEELQYRGPGIANVIGGGSWVSEFEVITGLDSRLFGTAGRYTHDALSGFSRHAFPQYLRDRGYDVAAFTPDSPLFFNSERAYKFYGFENYHGNVGRDDLTIMSNALAAERSNPAAPFLKFIIFTDNHSPHRCVADHAATYEKIEFVNKASPEQICALQEYLWRAKSSEKAVSLARAYLAKEQARTGRPYVIAIYGDHQPYTFTGGSIGWSLGLDFAAHRRDTSKRLTILEFISSKRNPFTERRRDPIPLTLLPTMVSAYVAESPEKLYLPENFYQIDHCGGDWIGYLVGRLFYDEADVGKSRASCDKYEALTAAYQKTNVLSLIPIEDVSGKGFLASLQAVLTSWVTAAKKPTVDQLTVDAAGTRFMELPRVKVFVDDGVVGQLDLSNAIDNTNRKVEAQEIYLSSQLSTFSTHSCLQRIAFQFENDGYAGENATGDRNVLVKSAALNGVPIPLATAKIEPADAGQVGNDGGLWMWRSGVATINVEISGGC